MNNNKPLTIITGRTASGKDTIADKLKSDKRTMVISHTTRPKRKGERDTHIFVDSIEPYKDRWLETTIQGHSYFILEEDLEKHDILVIDAIGFKELVEIESFKRPYRLFYLDIPLPVRRERYLKRDKISVEDFIKRNSSEDLQFTDLEELLKDKEYRHKHNVKIIRDDKDIQQAVNTVINNISIDGERSK